MDIVIIKLKLYSSFIYENPDCHIELIKFVNMDTTTLRMFVYELDKQFYERDNLSEY